MKNNVHVSVIVPVYNVEHYVGDCLDSLEGQIFEDFEIILVDDGSTDGSGAICREREKQNRRIRYYYKENGGLSDARNYGLEIARGEYIAFVDSDDYIHPQLLGRLYGACRQMQSEIAMCFYVPVKDDGSLHLELCELTGNRRVMGREEVLRALCTSHISTPFEVATCKLYHRRLFESVRFLKGKLHEDTATTYKLYRQADRVAVLSDKLYCYRQRESSITHVFSKKRLDLIDILEERQSYYETLENAPLALQHYEYVLNQVCRLRSAASEDKEIYTMLHKKYREWLKRDLFCCFPMNKKMKYAVAKRCPKLVDYLLKTCMRRRNFHSKEI